MLCSNLGNLVYTCVLCVSYSNPRLITGIRTHVFSKTRYHVSKGRSLIGRAGVLIAWPSPIVPKFPSRGNFGDDGHVALGNESGFPKFPQNKIFRWRLCIWQSSPCLALLSKICFLKTICRIWTLWFRLRTVTNWVRTVAREAPRGRVHSFWRLCWAV